MAGYRRVRAGLERSLKAARAEGTITDAHGGMVAAARVLADRLDDNLPGDNVSHSVFLKYMVELGFTPMARGKIVQPVVVEEPKPPSMLEKLQAKVQAQKDAGGLA